MELERKVAVALKWNAIAKVLGQTFSWVVTLLVVRLLTPDDYGLMAITAVVIAIIAGVAEFGFGASLVQAQNFRREDLARIAGALVAMNLICGLAVASSASMLASLFHEPGLEAVIRVASLQFLLYAIDVVPQSLMQRDMNFKKNAAIELWATFSGSAVTLTLAWLGYGVWALVIGNLASGGLRTALLVSTGTFVLPSFRLAGIGRHLRFGGTLTLSRFLWQLTYQSDVLIAGRFLTQEAVGLYSVATHLASLPMVKIMGVINQVAFPAVARLQDELPRLRRRLLDSLRLLAFVTVPLLWGISVVAPEFVDVVLGPKWHPVILQLQIIAFIVPVRMLMAILSTALAAIGQANAELRNMMTSTVVLPIAFLVGVQAGLSGLALAWAVAMPLVFVINLPRTSRLLELSYADLARAVRVPLLAGIGMYAAVTAVRFALAEYDALLRLPLLVGIGAASYLVGVHLLDRTFWADVKRVAALVRGLTPAV